MSDTAKRRAPILSLLDEAQKSNLIKQGAEAKIYISTLFPTATGAIAAEHQHQHQQQHATSKNVLIKYRFPKTYRHPSLSAHLTASRTTAEARALVRCARAGVNTPRILCVDEEEGVLGLEIVDGYSLREVLGGGSEGEDEDEEERQADVELLSEADALEAMRLVGVQLARMHQAHIIHGDLTTSNMMVKKQIGHWLEIILIDFGLSTNSTSSEDKAVDLYVLERAFASTHPSSEHLFAKILSSYQEVLEHHPIKHNAKVKADKGTIVGPTHWKDVKRKLDDVRLRGRKRSMVG